MGKKLEDIFNECCERLLQGESIESCLKSYPKEAARLEPLLRVAANIHKKATSIQARPEFKWQARTRLEGAFLYNQRQKLAKQKTGFDWQRSWALAVTTILVVLVVGAGTVAASTQAMPDEALYPLKLATEQAQLNFTISDVAKVELHTRLAERRINEITQMARQNKPLYVIKVTEQLTTHLDRAEIYACPQEETRAATEELKVATAPPPEPLTEATPPQDEQATSQANQAAQKQEKIREYLEHSAARNIAALELALQQAPEEAKPALHLTIEITKKRYDRLLKRLGEAGGTLPTPQDESQEEDEINPDSSSPEGNSQEEGEASPKKDSSNRGKHQQDEDSSTSPSDNTSQPDKSSKKDTEVSPSLPSDNSSQEDKEIPPILQALPELLPN